MNKVKIIIIIVYLNFSFDSFYFHDQSHRYIGSDESGDENRPRGKSGRIGRKGV